MGLIDVMSCDPLFLEWHDPQWYPYELYMYDQEWTKYPYF